MLAAALKKWGYDVALSTDGEQAYAAMQEPDPPRLVVLDWMMPKMDGIEVCRKLRADETEHPPYIILLTARGEKDDIVSGLEAGANDYLSKPYDPQELRARVDIGRRMISIQDQLVARVHEHQRAEKRLAEARRKEVRIAGRIQDSLLIGRAPGAINGMQVAAMTIPSRQVDGDFYDFFPLASDSLDIVFGDVMGKGVPAALLGAGAKGHVLRVLNGMLPNAEQTDLPRPREIMASLHAAMVRELMALDSFITLCYARIKCKENVLVCVDCGHTGILHWRAKDKAWRTVHGKNVPLGFSPRDNYEEVSTDIAPDDVLVFFSDGITEAARADGCMFGEDRLVETIQRHVAEKPGLIVKAIHDSVIAFTGSEEFADDLTCVVVRIDTDREQHRLAVETFALRADLKCLAEVRAALMAFCGRDDVPQMAGRDSDLLLLAVQEVATNIIGHAYPGDETGPLDLRLEAFPDAVRVTFTHTGNAFVSARPAKPREDGSQDQGYGLYMIDTAVDGCYYGRDEKGQNCVSLVKLI